MSAIDSDQLAPEDLLIEVIRIDEPVGGGVVTTVWIEGRMGRTTFATTHAEGEEEEATHPDLGERVPAQVQPR